MPVTNLGIRNTSTPGMTTISRHGAPTLLTLAAASSWTLYHRTPNPRPAGNPRPATALTQGVLYQAFGVGIVKLTALAAVRVRRRSGLIALLF
jgi:hypothetical protein